MKFLPFLLLAAGCAGQVDNAVEVPSCDPGSIDVRVLSMPKSVSEIDEALASEWEVTGCVPMANPAGVAAGDQGRTWCCWKAEAKPVRP
jgi:hypothetical protein